MTDIANGTVESTNGTTESTIEYHVNDSLEWVRRSYLLDLVRRADKAEAHATQLKAVADAARAVRRNVQGEECPPWEQDLFDALDVLDALTQAAVAD